jgi:hypothetical protein
MLLWHGVGKHHALLTLTDDLPHQIRIQTPASFSTHTHTNHACLATHTHVAFMYRPLAHVEFTSQFSYAVCQERGLATAIIGSVTPDENVRIPGAVCAGDRRGFISLALPRAAVVRARPACCWLRWPSARWRPFAPWLP